jgi:molybdopterin-guanine dinucleotide biosynthesis protein A
VDETSTIVAVIAGGQGQRMGGAKASALLAGRPLISYPLSAARAAGLEAIVVAKPATKLPRLQEQVVLEPELPVHPLCGVIAALEYASESTSARAVVLLACDMPFLTGPLLAWLAGSEGAAMAEVEGRAQPLLARCPTAQSAQLHEALAAGSSLTAAMERLAPQKLDERKLRAFGAPARLCFNVNSPEDLLRAEGWLA